MIKLEKTQNWALRLVTASVLLFATYPTPLAAQAAPPKAPQPSSTAAAPASQDELEATQEELLKLLRTSPTLTTVVAHDPSLLSNVDYVNKNNPQLGQFLVQHPDIARNPEYYLFTNIDVRGRNRTQALQRAVWPEMSGPPQYSPVAEFTHDLAPLLAFASFIVGALWLTRQFLENRRWSRIFKLQSDVHARLIEKFGTTQELAAYMETEAGKRFLEAAPIPIDIDNSQRMPNAVARVLMPLQIGVVLVLLGVGFFLLRGVQPDMHTPMLVLGTIALMPGIGFILSAGITWVLAGRLGLIPDGASTSEYLATTRHQGRQ